MGKMELQDQCGIALGMGMGIINSFWWGQGFTLPSLKPCIFSALSRKLKENMLEVERLSQDILFILSFLRLCKG